MKKTKLKIAMPGRFMLAAWGITLAIGLVACKTTTTPEKPVGITNTALPRTTSQTAVAADTGKSAGHFYTCGMHPTVRSLDPDGKCPICQMPLLPAETVPVVDRATGKTTNAAAYPEISGYYSCPMHTTVLSSNSESVCPICGMPLRPVEDPVFSHAK